MLQVQVQMLHSVLSSQQFAWLGIETVHGPHFWLDLATHLLLKHYKRLVNRLVNMSNYHNSDLFKRVVKKRMRI